MEYATFVTIGDREEPSTAPLTRYEDDPHAWATEQAELLKARRFSDLDLINLADEVADVTRREYEELESDLARVSQHLIDWDHQPTRRGRSWAITIKEHRRRVDRQISDNPSLKSRRLEALQEAFRRGRAEALIETDLPDEAVSDSNVTTWDDAMKRLIIWPEP